MHVGPAFGGVQRAKRIPLGNGRLHRPPGAAALSHSLPRLDPSAPPPPGGPLALPSPAATAVHPSERLTMDVAISKADAKAAKKAAKLDAKNAKKEVRGKLARRAMEAIGLFWARGCWAPLGGRAPLGGSTCNPASQRTRLRAHWRAQAAAGRWCDGARPQHRPTCTLPRVWPAGAPLPLPGWPGAATSAAARRPGARRPR